MNRLLLLLTALLLFVTTPASAVTPPEITVTKISPEIPAIQGVTDGTTVLIRNPAEELIVFDPKGQPFLKMTGSGVLERNGSTWEEVRKENFFYLHDGHVERAVLERKTLPYPWRIEGTYGGKPFVIEGTIVPAGTHGRGKADDATGATAAVLLFGGAAAALLTLVLVWRRKRRTP